MSAEQTSVVWSELCNTSLEAYLAYLRVNYYNGPSFVAGCGCGGPAEDTRCDGGCHNDGGGVDGTMCVHECQGGASRGCDGTGVDRHAGFEGVVGGCACWRKRCCGYAAQRLSSIHFGDCQRRLCCVASGVCHRSELRKESDAKVDGGELGSQQPVRLSLEQQVVGSEVETVRLNGAGEPAGKHWKKNKARREKKVAARKVAVQASDSGVSSGFGQQTDLQRELRDTFTARRIAENKLAVQRAEHQLKRNTYMTKSRVTELEWEAKRLQTDQKLQKITEARLGTKPGFAETLISAGVESTSLPSLSDGTISPDSSISVAQVKKMEDLISSLSGQLKESQIENTELKKSVGEKFEYLEDGRIKVPNWKRDFEARKAWISKLTPGQMANLGPDYHSDGRELGRGSALSTGSRDFDSEYIRNEDQSDFYGNFA